MMKWLRSILEWVRNLFCKKTMRRKISLYIADQLVDLDDQSFILFNYQMDDLSNPTIVKNSFSQQITLKGTPANNKIFGGSFRLDRRIGDSGGNSGVDFNASQKTPFVIYNEMSEILQSGYVKLDSVSRVGADIQYKITLYGGLGSFFYALSYDENGNKRTLADLDYLGTGNPAAELDFSITKEAVQEAWRRLRQDQTASPIWDIINFAPAYNGIPEGNFSPDKALVDPAEVGLQDTIHHEGVDYTTNNGYALVSLAEAQDEWAVKDLRSYLQRPVFSMKAFWNAICNPKNNGGYEVDASVVQDYLRFKYADMWMTLPLISSIGTIQQASGYLSLTMSSTPSSGNTIGRFDLVGSVTSGTRVTANINCKIRFNLPSGADAYTGLYNRVSRRYGRNTESKGSILFIQAVAYGSDDTIVGGSKIKVFGAVSGAVSGIAAACGYVPAWSAEYESLALTNNTYDKVSSGVFEIPDEVGFSVEAQDVAYYKILVSRYSAYTLSYEGGSQGGYNSRTSYSGDGSTSTPDMWVDFDTNYIPNSTFIIQGVTPNSVSYTTSESLRSGAIITKAMLLSTQHTPADYMLSFCKIFGLYFTYDVATRKVTIHKRNDLYQDETIDLSKRVDVSKGISIQPLVFKAKWYDFSLEGDGGAFYDEYLKVEGIPYGIQRVNTGYDFNADSINLMDSVVFKNACTILARSKYFNYIFKGQTFQPSPFLDKGNKYTLWSADGDTLETDISCPPDSASVTYYNDNPDLKGYDVDLARKLELRSADNKPLDGSDILVFLEGWNHYEYFKLTDDVPAMDVVNDGVPCWLLGAGGAGKDALYIPIFQRYNYGGFHTINDSLDFGIPRQLDIPNINYPEGCTIYERGWKKYLSDRYDANTKVMTCKVDFSGMQVNQDLLRKFYWYENSIWVLNKITNYSLTTYDPVECEFVQVQDKANYLTGQY